MISSELEKFLMNKLSLTLKNLIVKSSLFYPFYIIIDKREESTS